MKTHQAIEGEGETVTLIHGVGADLESWDGVVAALGGGYRILRYDLRGHGASEKVPGPYSLDDFVDDLVELLDRLDIRTTHLVGFSLGGLIAQAFALAHPHRLKRLVLVSTVAGRTPEERDKVEARARQLAEQGAPSHVEASLSRWFTDGFLEANRDVVQKRLERSLTNDPHCYAAAYRVLAESDLAGRLHEIAAPALVMTGEHDIGSTARMARLIAGRIPGAKLRILPRLKHSVLLEAPDKVAGHIRTFLEN
ncbi:MAG: alpha/beta fold hydrolase [Hyphomicrobiales bacterium]